MIYTQMDLINANSIVGAALIELRKGNPKPVEDNSLFFAIGDLSMYFLNKEQLDDFDIDTLGILLNVANIIYNNLPIDDDNLFLDNGVYDMLVEKYRMYAQIQIGGDPIQFNYTPVMNVVPKKTINLVERMDLPEDMLFKEYFNGIHSRVGLNLRNQLITRIGHSTGKKLRVNSHEYPELVGTLDKCKFVLDKQAEKAGVLNDPKVKIFERDFIAKAIKNGIITPDEEFMLTGELKYDGVSVVVHVKEGIVTSAISRGDTGMDAAIDYTPILYGYVFPGLLNYPEMFDLEFEIKCEAVMLYKDLYSFNEVRGYDYKNPRSAIIGLTGLNDGYKYRDFITLVPLDVICTTDNYLHHSKRFGYKIAKEPMNGLLKERVMKYNFIDLYLANKIYPKYVPFYGNITTILYQVNKFVEEMKAVRPYMPVMYDGVVISFLDYDKITKLGRENFTNQWQMAIKFPTLKRETTLLGITYTVGQNGVITPMAHYQPIEFLGTTHTKSSISSLKRFNENEFKLGNTIEVEYINDVMPYVSTPDHLKEKNKINKAELIKFIDHCPACGGKLEMGAKTARCINPNCNGRAIARMANMMDKLGIKGFAEETMQKLGVKSLVELINMDRFEAIEKLHSEILVDNLGAALKDLCTTKRYDYQLVGALGFTNIATATWELIFKNITIQEIIDLYENNRAALENTLLGIKGIGKATVDTIMNELPLFLDDIRVLSFVMINSKGTSERKKIRMSGIRDHELEVKLTEMGYDADSTKGVTKDTYILLIPHEGYTSSKTSKIGPNTKVIVLDEFKENFSKYLQ